MGHDCFADVLNLPRHSAICVPSDGVMSNVKAGAGKARQTKPEPQH